MSLIRYLREGKLEVLYRKIESSIQIQLKTVPCQLINKSRLEKHLESSIRRESAIVITVSISKEATRLCSKGLRFEGALKVVEKYWEVRSGLVYLSCAGIDHDCLRDCGDRVVQYVICADIHKVENYKYGITEYTIRMGKICTNVISKCTNCGVKH